MNASKSKVVMAILGIGLLASGAFAFAQGIDQCNAALVTAHLSTHDTYSYDYRLASFVDERTWDEASHNGSGNAVIYGVPAGATYSDFQNRVRSSVSALTTGLSATQIRNVLWTGLDPSGSTAYSRCIDAIANQAGLHLFVVAATSSDITIKVRWTPQGSQPSQIPVTWTGVDAALAARLPKTVFAGGSVAVLPRPSKDMTVGVNYPGYGEAVVLTPLPPPVIIKAVVWSDYEMRGGTWDWIAPKVNNECRPSDSTGIRALVWSGGLAENYAYAVALSCREDQDTRYHWELLPAGTPTPADGPDYWKMATLYGRNANTKIVLKRVMNPLPAAAQ